jgi:hypothetical protein
MPTEFPQYPGEGDPRPSLQGFLYTFRHFLHDLLLNPSDGNGRPLFEKQFLDDLQKAWVETMPHFDDAIKALDKCSDEDLEKHGLVGVALRIKLRIVEWWNQQYARRGKPVLGRFLRVVDGAVLDSILDLIKGGKLISEFKEVVDGAIASDE